MPKSKKADSRASFQSFVKGQMKDPKFRRACDELEPEYQIMRQIIDLRLKRRMTQTELARRIGAPQPSIARLERRGKTRDLDYLQRVAKALDARLEVRLVPREAKGSKANGRRTKHV